jgi:hypothetical protein
MKKAASFEGCLNTLPGNDFRDSGFSDWTRLSFGLDRLVSFRFWIFDSTLVLFRIGLCGFFQDL